MAKSKVMGLSFYQNSAAHGGKKVPIFNCNIELVILQCLLRERFITQLCLHIWLGGMPVLLASPKGTSFWPS
jgi:hypothetical protein